MGYHKVSTERNESGQQSTYSQIETIYSCEGGMGRGLLKSYRSSQYSWEGGRGMIESTYSWESKRENDRVDLLVGE
ncbi:hypothetical protein N7475_003952 [Penicillium sp. IBT 31633x]|nr:hypothetical protein N7475_003952 [Penicillium sp. IBT 31633x]